MRRDGAYTARMGIPYLGVHESAPSTITPVARWGREFVSGSGGPLPESTTATQLISKVNAVVDPHINAGGKCVVSVKLDMVKVAQGTWNSKLQALGTALDARAQANKVKVIFNHEPENDMTGSVFAAGFNEAKWQIKQTSPMLDVCYAAMSYQWRPGASITADPVPWQAVQADLYLCDVYFGKSFAQSARLSNHAGFQRWMTQLVIPANGGVQRWWGLAEYGRLASSPASLRASGFTQDFAWLKTAPGCEMILGWNTAGTEGDNAWIWDSTAKAAFKAGLESVA